MINIRVLVVEVSPMAISRSVALGDRRIVALGDRQEVRSAWLNGCW
jgi:hypothetical protein